MPRAASAKLIPRLAPPLVPSPLGQRGPLSEMTAPANPHVGRATGRGEWLRAHSAWTFGPERYRFSLIGQDQRCEFASKHSAAVRCSRVDVAVTKGIVSKWIRR